MDQYQLLERLSDGSLRFPVSNRYINTWFFFRYDDELCYRLDSHIDFMKAEGLFELELYLAKRETAVPYFFCKHVEAVGLKEESDCGRGCQAYEPRNKKAGVCRHYGYTYERTSKQFVLRALGK